MNRTSQSQYIVINDNTDHKVAWGKDEVDGWYVLVFNANRDIVVALDQRFDGITESDVLTIVPQYGVDPLYVARTIQRER